MANVIFTYKGNKIFNDRLRGTGTEPKYLAWGTGAGTFTRSSTGLFTESTGEARVACSTSTVTLSQTGDTWQASGTVQAASTKTITNAGLFTSATHSAGDAFLLADFTGIPLATGESIAFVWKIKGL